MAMREQRTDQPHLVFSLLIIWRDVGHASGSRSAFDESTHRQIAAIALASQIFDVKPAKLQVSRARAAASTPGCKAAIFAPAGNCANSFVCLPLAPINQLRKAGLAYVSHRHFGTVHEVVTREDFSVRPDHEPATALN